MNKNFIAEGNLFVKSVVNKNDCKNSLKKYLQVECGFVNLSVQLVKRVNLLTVELQLISINQ